LQRIKALNASVPVVMVTKSEEEDIMEDAIGAKISDYLIKPVKPQQILLTIKKNVNSQHLISQKATSGYQTQFGRLSMDIGQARDFEDWKAIYKKLVYWELELGQGGGAQLDEVIQMQKGEANGAFGKFVAKNYLEWLDPRTDHHPLMSPNLFKDKVLPLLDQQEQVFFILVDNLRFDQWKILEPSIAQEFRVLEEDIYCSILPTATQYARNAIFSGLMPSEIEKLHPEFWVGELDEGGKNLFEQQLIEKMIARFGRSVRFNYDKVSGTKAGGKLVDSFSNIKSFPLNVLVFNFIDMLSHARTEMQVIKELARDEAAYRSITQSWFEHSSLRTLLHKIAELPSRPKVILTTDHGTVRVQNPLKVIGDRETSTNLRYKEGRNLSYKAKSVFEITNPKKAFLPSSNLSSAYIFAYGQDFFAYPNNYNHYVNLYKGSFQHGGISLEEMMVPLITLQAK